MYVLVLIVMSMTNGVDTKDVAVHSVSGFHSEFACLKASDSLKTADDYYENSYSIQDAVCVKLEDEVPVLSEEE